MGILEILEEAGELNIARVQAQRIFNQLARPDLLALRCARTNFHAFLVQHCPSSHTRVLSSKFRTTIRQVTEIRAKFKQKRGHGSEKFAYIVNQIEDPKI